MKTLTVISDAVGPVAFLVEQSPTVEQIKFLHRLAGDHFVHEPVLARRWNVHTVLCLFAWGRIQLKRKPMLKPQGQRMALLEDPA